MHTGVHLLQMNSRVNDRRTRSKMAEAQPGIGRLIALCSEGHGRVAETLPSFLVNRELLLVPVP